MANKCVANAVLLNTQPSYAWEQARVALSSSCIKMCLVFGKKKNNHIPQPHEIYEYKLKSGVQSFMHRKALEEIKMKKQTQ